MKMLGIIKKVNFWYITGDAEVIYEYGRRTYKSNKIPKKILDFMINCNSAEKRYFRGTLTNVYYENK